MKKTVFSIPRDEIQKQLPKYRLGDLVGTTDIKRYFSKGHTTNWSFISNTVPQLIHNTGLSYQNN